MHVTRLLTMDDVEALARLLADNRDFLAPWEPLREDAYFSVDGQRDVIAEALHQHAEGRSVPCAVLGEDGAVVGRINLNSVIRGAFQSCSIGYWVARSHNGNGLATRAVAEMTAHAFDRLGLHRVQGETLAGNVASRRVLERNGFVRYGLAPRYLRIAGRWQDCVLHQLLAEDRDA